MINKIIIFGGHIQALGIARQAKAIGMKVIICCDDKYSVARFSKAVDRFAVCSGESETKSFLRMYESEEKTCLLFPTNDEMVEFMARNYDELSRKFVVGVPGIEVIELFNNKRRAYRFAEENGIACPKCWYPDTMEDVEDLSDELPYPVVVKPAVMYSFHKTFEKKAFRCDTKEELMAIYGRVEAVGYDIKSILIQEFLSGGPKYLYSYGTFAVDGESKAYLVANRVRQNPMDFGNSTTFAVTCDVQEIKESAEKILKMVNYFGLGEVEFMYDPKSEEYKFLEINTRAWKWHTISNQLGFSFIGEMIRWINGEDLTWRESNKNVYWTERLTDWTVSAKEILKGRMSVGEFLKSFRVKKEYAVWSRKDILPWVMYVVMSPILFVKRH